MNNYEKLLDLAEKDGITVTENFDLSQTRLKGLYCNGVIAINQKIKTNTEKTGILAEELGHHYTTFGDILNQKSVENRKQELKARAWAYNKLIGLIGIVSSYKASCRNIYEIAEYLEVSEEFLLEALECYRRKYGRCTKLDNYIIYFEPCLEVMELI